MAAIRARSIEDRLDEWADLNRAVAEMEADAVLRRHPEYDDRQVFLAVVRQRYGDDLARRVWPEATSVDP